MSPTAAGVQARGRRAAHSDWVQRAARFGLVVRGALYVLVGVLTLQLAGGERRRPVDSTGALGDIARKPLAALLLVAIVVGLCALAAWRLAQAALDTDGHGHDREGILQRSASFARGVLYLAASVWAASFLLGPRGKERTDESDLSSRLVELPGGRWLLGLIGVGILAGCILALLRLLRGGFEEDLKLDELPKHIRPRAKVFAVVGLIARLVIVALVGLFVLRAAIQHDPRQGVGLDHALRELLDHPAGTYWAGLAAAALITFGCYSLFEARYREVLHS